MGLPLRHPTSFTSLTSGASSPGGPTIPDSDSDLDASAPSSHSYRHQHLRSPHRRSRSSRDLSSKSNRNRTHPQQHRKHPRLQSSHLTRHRAGPLRPAAAGTHHVKPHNPWAADADEGRALARSDIPLPGEYTQQLHHHKHQHERHRRSSSRSSSGSDCDGRQRRPPSLERQDAFRDEKTVKRRRLSADEPSSSLMVFSFNHDDDAREVAELYRIGLLYDDEHERGEGFSLLHIVHEEPVYSVRVRPARRGRREESDGFVPTLAVDLAFSAFAEDEALAGWMVSGSSQRMGHEELFTPWQKAAHDTPRLTVIYELADDAASALSADDFLGSVSVSEVSHFVEEEGEDELDWAFLDRCNGNEHALSATVASSMVEADDDEVDPWVVLGHDGS